MTQIGPAMAFEMIRRLIGTADRLEADCMVTICPMCQLNLDGFQGEIPIAWLIDQIAPGTQCIIYRENPLPGAPRLLVGELAILTTGDHWSTAKVIRSTGQMYVGDRVQVK